MSFLTRLFRRPKLGKVERQVGFAATPLAQDAKMLFLSKFTTCQSVGRLVSSEWAFERWSVVLGIAPLKAAEWLERERLLVRPNLSERLEGWLALPQLKELCAARKLKVSGKKSELAARLVQHGGEELETLAPLADQYICSSYGREIAESYQARKKAEKQDAQLLCADLLDAHDFEAATKAVGDYEAKQVFRRGINCDWESGKVGLGAVKAIYGVQKSFLRNVWPNDLANIRLIAALDDLWGEEVSIIPDREAPVKGCQFNLGIAARQLRMHHSSVPAEVGLPTGLMVEIEYLAANGDCPACMARNGQRYPVGGAPELPSDDCTCELGCRCTFGFIVNDGIDD